MGDVLWQHEAGHQVVDRSRFTTVRSQHKCVEAASSLSDKCTKYPKAHPLKSKVVMPQLRITAEGLYTLRVRLYLWIIKRCLKWIDNRSNWQKPTIVVHYKCIPLPSQVVEYSHVGVGVIEVVRVGWVVLLCPVRWQRTVEIKNVVLGFWFIVHAVKAHHLSTHKTRQRRNSHSFSSPVNHQDIVDFCGRRTHMIQEEMQLRMAAGVDCDLKQRHEDILQHLLEISQLLLCVVHITRKGIIERSLLLSKKFLCSVWPMRKWFQW